MRLAEHLSLFRNEFNKFNNTGGQIIRFYLLYGIKNTLNLISGVKTS